MAINWLRLGQLEFQAARLAFREGKPEAACEALLRAFSCVHLYSQNLPVLQTMRRLVRGDLAALGDAA